MISHILLLLVVIVIICSDTNVISSPSSSAFNNNNNNNDEYKLVWEENFDGTVFNYSRFGFDLGFGANQGEQYYTDRETNTFLTGNGTMVIRARNDIPVKDKDGHIISHVTSSNLYTKDNFTYGKIVASLKVPTGVNGTWPAFWLLGIPSNSEIGWPKVGEIDIMENVGYDPQMLFGTTHDEKNNGWRGNQKGNHTLVQNMSESFILYGAEWTPFFIRFFYNYNTNTSDPEQNATEITYFQFDNDGHCQMESWPYYKLFQIKLNMAIGGTWGGAHGVAPNLLPVDYECDFIRVFSKASFPAPDELMCSVNFYSMKFDFVLKWFSQKEVNELVFGDPAVMDRMNKALNEEVLPNAFFGNSSEHLTRDTVYDKIVYVNAIAPVFSSSSSFPPSSFARYFTFFVNFSMVNFDETKFEAAREKALSYLKDYASPIISATLLRTDCYVASDSFSLQGTHQSSKTERLPFDTFSIPNTNIRATSYDYGGAQVAYRDTTVWNQNDDNKANTYRAGLDAVDIAAYQQTAAGVPDSFFIGYIVEGEWLRYSSVYFAANESSSNNSGSSSTKKAITAQFSLRYAFNEGPNKSGLVNVEFISNNDSDSSSSYSFDVTLPTTTSWNKIGNSTPLAFTLDTPGFYTMILTFKSSLVLDSINMTSTYVKKPTNNNNQDDGLSPKTIDILIGSGVALLIVVVAVYVGVVVFLKRREARRQSEDGVPGVNPDGSNNSYLGKEIKYTTTTQSYNSI